ncbi:pentapeptide repeat-containing protein [Melissospora conviva]|uniref:pentapeptide repeat-containing protein n=1 Tax=Melissospora conviva TaxID=3388432 RepID=UPI003C245C64
MTSTDSRKQAPSEIMSEPRRTDRESLQHAYSSQRNATNQKRDKYPWAFAIAGAMLIAASVTLSGSRHIPAAVEMAFAFFEEDWPLKLLTATGVGLVLTGLFQVRRKPSKVPLIEELKPMPAWSLAAAFIITPVMGAGATLLIAGIAASANPDQQAVLQVEAIKIGLSVVAGCVGISALLIALRRQWLNERTQAHSERLASFDQAHRERLAAEAEHDAAEKRITDLFVKAADQLGSETATVRMAGLIALERVGQNNPSQRQAIIDLLCAYLRMPFDASAVTSEEQEQPDVWTERHAGAVQELQVRLTAQRIIASHVLNPPRGPVLGEPVTNSKFWKDLILNLRGATLVALDISSATVDRADFRSCKFIGVYRCEKTMFINGATFDGATFNGPARLGRVTFGHKSSFREVTFSQGARFSRAVFESAAPFNGSAFLRLARFDRVKFARAARLGGAYFARGVKLDRSEVRNVDSSLASTLPPGWSLSNTIPDAVILHD